MSASISTKSKSIPMNFLKQTSGYIANGAINYITDSMPFTTSTLHESKNVLSEASSALANTTQSILPKIKQLNVQQGFKGIYNWFMQKEDEFGNFDTDLQLEWDDGTMSANIAESQISELDKTGNKISRSVVESSHRMVEAQVSATANLITSVDKQTTVISTGFDKTNETLNKILDVITKNTAAIIETTAATSYNELTSASDRLLTGGRFNLSDYKKSVSQNIKTEFGMAGAMLSMFSDKNMIKALLSPEYLTGIAMEEIINKKAPNLKNNLKAFDDALNDTVLSSLIRLGDNNDSFSVKGKIAKIFGISSDRKTVGTERSELELKSIQYDTISKEAITNAIPGYLRKILVAVGGEDTIYDYRSRKFVSKKTIKNDFRKNSTYYGTKSYGSGKHINEAMGFMSDFENMSYELMMNELGSRVGKYGNNVRDIINSFQDKESAEKYVLSLYNDNLTKSDRKEVSKFAEKLSNLSGFGKQELLLQINKNNVIRNSMLDKYVKRADDYGMDLSFIKDNKVADSNYIKKMYGRNDLSSKHDAGIKTSDTNVGKGFTAGMNYINIALYEIYRRLNEGINVFQVGKKHLQDSKFERLGDDYLIRPTGYNPKTISAPSVSSERGRTDDYDSSSTDDSLYDYDFYYDGEENLSKGEKIARWGKKRGGDLANAIVFGKPEQVREAFGAIIHDVTEVGGESVKKGVSRINTSFSNISGYLQHKIFGTEYTYQTGVDEDGNPITKSIAKNEKGGIFGWIKDNASDIFGDTKGKAEKWYSEVADYFDYGENSDDPKEKKLAGKRKQIIGASIGAFAGAGLLGGPLGLLFGAIAGNALSTSDIGAKIKEKLFGIDKESGEATGLLSKAADAVVRPLQYQFEKTLNHLGGALKKGLLGPLSDIGFAIKNRVSEKAESVFGKFFEKAVGALTFIPKKIGQGIGWLAGKAFSGATGAGGEYVRGMMSATSTASSGILGSAAYILGGKENVEAIHERRAKRKKEVDAERHSFSSYEDWNKNKNKTRANRLASLEEYMAEDVVIAKKTEENTSKIVADVSSLEKAIKGEIIPGSSFKSHDAGVHKRLDTVISIISGGKYDFNSIDGFTEPIGSGTKSDVGDIIKKSSESSSNEGFANSAISAAAVIAGSGDTVNDTESRLTGDIIDEASKDKSSKAAISQKLKDLIGNQKKKITEVSENRESLWTKLLEGIGGIVGNLPAILTTLGALYFLIKNPDGVLEILKGIGVSVKNIVGLVGGDSSTDPATTGANIATGALGVQADSIFDYATPGAKLYHDTTDAAGNKIVHSSATDLKETLLWKDPLRSNIVSKLYNGSNSSFVTKSANTSAGTILNKVGSKGSFISADLKNSLATKLSERRPGFVNSKLYNKLQTGSEIDLERSVELDERSKRAANVSSTVGRQVARAGATYIGSNIVGGVAKLGARLLGRDEESAERIGDVFTGGTSALLVADAGISEFVGKKSIVDKIIDGIKRVCSNIGESVSKNKKFQKIGKSKIVSKLSSLATKICSGLKTKLDSSIIGKITKKLTAYGAKVTASTATAGITIAVGAVAGLASGLCSVEHLFGVLPGEATAGMKVVAGALEAAFGAVEWSPFGWVVIVFDIIDDLVATIPGVDSGIKQAIARGIYELFSGDDTLSQKQEAFTTAREKYNNKFGTNLSQSEFNDAVNSTGAFNRFINGSAKVDENGEIMTDDAGSILKFGGLKNLFFGNDHEYMKDASGNVIKSSDGTAVIAKDKFGNTLKKNNKFGDHLRNVLNARKRFLFGGDVYKVDDNGNPVLDEDGNYVVDHTEGNIIKRIFGSESVLGEQGTNTISSISNKISTSISNFFGSSDDEKTAAKNMKTPSTISDMVNKVFTNVTSTISDINKELDEDSYLLDEDGNKILDADGTPIRKNGLKDFITSGIGKITFSMFSPVTLLTGGIVKWVENNLPWKKDGSGSVLDWLNTKLKSFATIFSDDESTSTTTTTTTPTTSSTTEGVGGEPDEEGGNPLNKPYKITSAYGPRTYPHSGMHKGVDLVPADGSPAEVGSRFNGTVSYVKSNVADSDTAKKVGNSWQYTGSNSTGNMVTVTTDDGLVIKNMHLKAGSIPSNIKVGAKVKVGDKLGDMGSTGWSTGAHLHYQIEQGEGNHIDPTSSVQNGSQISDFTSSSSTTHPATESEDTSTSSTFSFSNDGVNGDASTTTGSGVIGDLLTFLKGAGNTFLNKLTGGLIGDVSTSSTSSENNNSSYTGTNTSDVSKSITSGTNTTEEGIVVTSKSYSQWVNIVRKVKELIASKKPQHSSSGSMSLEFNGKRITFKPDAIGIIGAMLKLYEAIPVNTSINTQMLLKDDGISSKFTKISWPGWNKLVEGDILVSTSHAEIFAANNGNTHYVYNGGSTSALQSPGATKSSRGQYQVIWRCKEAASTASIATTGVTIQTSSTPVKRSGEQDIWNYLTKLGYNDIAKAGIMGVWSRETNNRNDRLEGDYLGSFPGFESVLKNNKSLNDYTKNNLWQAYYKDGISISEDGYYAKDGNLYPGIGIAQWTGPRAYDLFNHAKSKGMDWRNLDGQMEFFHKEMSEKSRGISVADMNSQSNVRNAAKLFANKYEGTHNSSWVAERQAEANRIYNSFANENPTDGGVGGPPSSINSSSYTPKSPTRTTKHNTGMTSTIKPPRNNNLELTDEYRMGHNESSSNSGITSEIVTLLYQVIKQLESISSNTGTSNNLLGSLGEKGFIDKGLRDQLSSLSKVQKSTSRYSQSNPTNTRMVVSMARP